MKRVLRTGLAFAAGTLALVALDAVARGRGAGPTKITRKLLDLLRPAHVPDETVETRVRNKLARTASEPRAITVSIEHGCVDLRGAVPTRERARIVRAIATVPGVDSVLDLMTEPSLPSALARPAATALAHTHALGAWPFQHTRWPLLARILVGVSGLGLTLAGLRAGGPSALPAATLGLFVIARAASALRRPPALPIDGATTVKPLARLERQPPREPQAPF